MRSDAFEDTLEVFDARSEDAVDDERLEEDVDDEILEEFDEILEEVEE